MTPLQHFIRDHKNLRGPIGFEFILDLAIAINETLELHYVRKNANQGETKMSDESTAAPVPSTPLQQFVSHGQHLINLIEDEAKTTGSRELSLARTKVDEFLFWITHHFEKKK